MTTPWQRPAAPSRSATSVPGLGGWRARAFVEQVMGLPVSIHVRAADPDRDDVADAVRDVWRLLHEVDDVFSTWRADSEVMRVRAGRLAPHRVSPWVGEVWALGVRARTASRGLFTTDLVGPDGTRGWDPTGIVKGWSVDRAVERLRGVPGIGFAVNAGGDIRCGRTADGPEAPWGIGIEDPEAPGTVAYSLPLVEGALATSGTAARGRHIVDPRTGRAPRTDITSITVVGPELTWADMWATVCFIDPGALADAGPEWSDYRVAGTTPAHHRAAS